MTPEQILEQAFDPAKFRDPRSPEYKAGVLAALKFRLQGHPITLPYPVGTAQADAFFSGLDEGHRLARGA